MVKKKTSIYLIALSVLVLFILFSIAANLFVEQIQSYIGSNFLGMTFYILVFILEILAAPITAVPLIPFATSLWGWAIAGTLTLIGWTIGSSLVFLITRKWGTPFLRKRKLLTHIEKFEHLVPERNIFIGIVLLRFFLPFDIISYAIGLLSDVKFKTYFAATVIGFAPLAFILAYGAKFSLNWQLLLLAVGIIIIFLFFKFSKKNKDKVKDKAQKVWDKKFSN
jgi:uncharacterized membrane protein YdjX (TVP38/TMEM64 family)